MADHRRRDTIGPFASAALPALWKALARKGWTHTDFARAVGITTAGAARVLYGDNGAGRRVAARCHELLGVKPILWDKPCPPNWKPHAYANLRPKLSATGTG